MCVSNPKLWEMQLAPLRKYAQQGARGLSVNACENDGSGGICTCKRCCAWGATPNASLASLPPIEDGSEVDGGPQQNSSLPDSLSDRYARWYNELAVRARKLDPDARVVAYAYRTIYSEATFRKAAAILARAKPLLQSASEEERERFHNIELGLQHGELLAAALSDGKTSNGPAGEQLMAFRRKIAPRNVINVYWTTSKEMRYGVFR